MRSLFGLYVFIHVQKMSFLLQPGDDGSEYEYDYGKGFYPFFLIIEMNMLQI